MAFYSNEVFRHRPGEIGRTWLWAELEKIARFKRLENSSLYFQNDLAFLGRIRKPSLSEFTEIYDLCVNDLEYQYPRLCAHNCETRRSKYLTKR